MFNVSKLKNWKENNKGEINLVPLQHIHTHTWRKGWYKNPSSGRSCNYGLNVDDSQNHQTVIIKGGDFFIENEYKKVLLDNNFLINEIYGGITQETAMGEYKIALLIQEKFQQEINKIANCPQPLDVKRITGVKSNIFFDSSKLTDFFYQTMRDETENGLIFTKSNFTRTVVRLGIDTNYPLKKEASEEARKDPWRWLINQCLEKTNQSVYRYKINGPNTRILDLMTLPLDKRQKYFIEANDVFFLEDAINKFSEKLGEFYGILHKHLIGYQSGTTEHCTLIDTTIAGIVMDIGGISQDQSRKHTAETYVAQMTRTTNLIAYICKNIFRTDNNVLKNALKCFWDKYKEFHLDNNVDYFSQEKNLLLEPREIRTKYVDRTTGNLIVLASDLKYLS